MMSEGGSYPVERVFLFSALTLFIIAWNLDGYVHPDEHFQILEFAGYKLDLTEKANLPWEFHQQMRPSIQPVIVVVIYRFFNLFGTPDPFFIAFVLRLLSSALSFFGMWLMYRAYEKEFRNNTIKRWFLHLSFFLWFLLLVNVRFTSETLSGSTFLIAFAYVKLRLPRLLPADYFLAGLLMGLSFIFRFQAGLLFAGFGLWFMAVRKTSIYRMLILLSGITVVFLSGLLMDRWFYGEWTITAWNYFQQNILFDKVSGFGIQPWWFYIQSTFFEGIPPFSLVYIAAVLLFFIFLRRDLITWTLMPFLMIHFFIGHKEMRFLFPVLGFLPVIIIKMVDLIRETHNQDLPYNKPEKYLARIFWGANLVMVAVVMIVPVDTETKLFQKIYRDYPSATTLYFVNENPYRRALDIHFYKRKNLTIEKVDSVEQIKVVSGRNSLVVTRTNPEIEGLKLTRKLIYCNFSDWIKHFNFNHWIERTHFWYVYELTPTHGP